MIQEVLPGNYSDNENYIYSFLPGTIGAMIKVVFSAFDVEEDTNCNYDWLKILSTDLTSPLPCLGNIAVQLFPDPLSVLPGHSLSNSAQTIV